MDLKDEEVKEGNGLAMGLKNARASGAGKRGRGRPPKDATIKIPMANMINGEKRKHEESAEDEGLDSDDVAGAESEEETEVPKKRGHGRPKKEESGVAAMVKQRV